MNLKKTMLAVLAGSAAMVSLPVLADNGWHGERDRWDHDRWEHRHHGYYGGYRYAPPPVAYGPRVIYAAPAYYPPAPVYYYPPAPVYYYPPPAPVYQPAPVFTPGISIRFRLPL